MGKKIVFFSTGIPDPTQGGSGIFNYLVCQELLKRNFELKAFFRVAAWFLDQCDKRYLLELAKAGLQYTLIEECEETGPSLETDKLLLQAHHLSLCRKAVEGAAKEIAQADGCISLDVGWAYGLSTRRPKRSVCFLSDPLHKRLRYRERLSPFSISTWKALWRSGVLRRNYYELLRKIQWPGAIFGMFGVSQAEEVCAKGVPCRYFRWFTAEVDPVEGPERFRGKLVALHVGCLDTAVSRSMIDYWTRKVFPALDRLPFEVELRLVGRTARPFTTNTKNIRLNFLGHKELLEEEFASADFYFSPVKYPAPVGTRIFTALSYGIPVVTDRSLQSRQPELVADKEIVYTSTPLEIRRVLEAISEDPKRFQALGRQGRLAWERYFRPSTNIGEILHSIGLNDE